MEPTLGCAHYKRKCEILAPCCKIWYGCRHCHNENYKGPKAPGCKIETMDRSAVSMIQCRLCKEQQPASNKCQKCAVVFARYYCDICKFWDDAENKSLFHCEKCGICRVGPKEIVTHCDKCNVCYENSVFAKHKCKEGLMNTECPVCLENLFNSTRASLPLKRCSHPIHYDCLNGVLLKSDRPRCPLCRKLITKESKEMLDFIDNEIEKTKANLPDEVKNMKMDIICGECTKISRQVPFHFLGLKCTNCGSYNTDPIDK